MSTIASKNLYELLGNDPELDPDRPADPPTKVIDKPVARVGKRNAGPEAPAAAAAETARAPAGPTGGRGGRTEGERLQRREGARDDNRERGERRPYRGDNNYRGRGEGRGRGGRGRGDRPPRDDRHSHTGVGDHAKQAAHGWGAEQDGNAELADEKAGEAIATAETKNEPGFSPDTNGADPAFSTGPDGEAAAAEEEEKTKTYDQYLAELAEKRLALGGGIEVRKANEGSKQKGPEGNAFTREEQDFFVGTGGKARKAKETVAKKEQVVIDGQYYAPAESGDRGGSRGGRGGRGGPRGGRGEFRGGDRGGRGRGRGGDFRGGARGSGERTGPSARGGAGFNATDESAFPALGGN